LSRCAVTKGATNLPVLTYSLPRETSSTFFYMAKPGKDAKPSLAPDVVESLVGGRHGDPFAVLGPHEKGRGNVVIRTFQPGAAKVSVVLGGEPVEEHPMQELHPAGLWETTVPGRSGLVYRLRITDHEGRTRDEDDPYRFPSTLSDFDLHLLAEGTHYRVY